MAQNTTVYNEAVQVTEKYLGPAGERFIRRQISTHLQIEPEELEKKNIPKLINWTTIAFALITKNSKELDSFKHDLELLTADGKRA